MKWKIVAFAVILTSMAALVWWSGSANRPRQVPKTPPPAMTSPPHALKTPLPTVDKVRIAVQDGSGKEFPPLELIPGEMTRLEGTPYKLRATDFYTHWNWDVQAVNLSRDEVNPAVKVEVWKDDAMLYYGWAFRNIPFFRMRGHSGAGEGGDQASSELAFTLVDYQGIRFAGQDAQ